VRILTFIFTALLLSNIATADTTNCNDLYVGSVTQYVGSAPFIVFKNTQTDSSGSYAQYLTGWTETEKNSALSMLLAAKMSGHRVNVRTTKASECDIQTGHGTLTYVQLANNP